MAVSSALDRVRWSESDYEMKDFVDYFGESLPMLCQTTSGYAGCDDDMHQVAADEVIWIYAIQSQTRIVAKDRDDRYISIPVENCQFKFQLHEDNKKTRSLVTASDLLTLFQQDSVTRVCFQFENDQTVSYQIGADVGNATRFGILELEESYDEKYLLGFGMHSGYVYSRTVGIPVYIDVSLARAIGFEEEEDKGEAFRRWMEELRKIVETFQKTTINTCQGVIVFPQRPSNGDYDYIRPANFLRDASKKTDKTQTETNTSKAENEYAYITAPQQGVAPLTRDTPNLPPTPTGSAPDGRKGRVDEIVRVPIPRIPRQAPPVPTELAERAPLALPISIDKEEEKEEEDEKEDEKEEEEEIPPAIPSRKPKSKASDQVIAAENSPLYMGSEHYHNVATLQKSNRPPVQQSYEMTVPGTTSEDCYTSLADNHPDHPYRKDPSKTPTRDPPIMDSPKPNRHGNRGGVGLPSTADRAPPPIPPLPQKWTQPVAKATAACVRMESYVTAAEVPRDVDAEDWTISDVIAALRLLKMDGHVDSFREREIDGALLCSLEEQVLVEDFGFKQFEATKFFMFVRKGWRPK